MLKQLFDEEIVEEDVFFEWATGERPLFSVLCPRDLCSRHALTSRAAPLSCTHPTDLTRNEYSAHLTMIDIDTLEALKTSAALFIKWLQEAEEEGEEEEEDDD